MTQCSAGSNLFFIRPWSTERTDGRWTSWRTNRWDCKEEEGGRGKGCHFYMVCGQSSYDGIKGHVYNYCRDLVQLETWNTAAPVVHMPGL